jgi:hypothetical protein
VPVTGTPQLLRLDPACGHPRGHPTPDVAGPAPEDFELCPALLYEAIGRAERGAAA